MIFYLCDKKKCEDCNGNEFDCIRTSSIEHAVNFTKLPNGDYEEQIALLEEQDSFVGLAKELNGLIDRYIQVRAIKFPYVDTFDEQRKQVERVCQNIELAISSLTQVIKKVSEVE